MDGVSKLNGDGELRMTNKDIEGSEINKNIIIDVHCDS